jgi:hypothetical protein
LQLSLFDADDSGLVDPGLRCGSSLRPKNDM